MERKGQNEKRCGQKKYANREIGKDHASPRVGYI